MCPSQFQFGYVMDGDWVVVGPAILCIKKTKLRLRSVAKRSEVYLNLFFLILELQSLTTKRLQHTDSSGRDLYPPL